MSFAQPADAGESRVITVTLKCNALTVVCTFGPGGRLLKKSERRAGFCRDFAYDFDAAGRLVRVTQGNEVTEQYRYNKAGQRSEQRRAPGRAFAL